MAEKAKTKLRVDVAKIVEIHNKNNPENPVNNISMAKLCDTSYQTLGNFNIGKIGKGMKVLDKLLEVSGAKYEDVVKHEKI